MISHIIEAAIEADCFDEIYINSESDVFEEIANSHKIKFYKRPDELSTDSSTNDDFVLDFINKNNLIDYKDCNIIQILPTSPFLTPNEIKEFVNQFNTSRDTTLVSVTENKIECLFEGEPINFDRLKHTPPSQLLKPILSYACALMGWQVKNYVRNMKLFDCAYHGGNWRDSKTYIGTYILRGLSCIDIDNESDFQLAEAIMRSGYKTKEFKPEYYNPQTNEHTEDDVPSILLSVLITLLLHDLNSFLLSKIELIFTTPLLQSCRSLLGTPSLTNMLGTSSSVCSLV